MEGPEFLERTSPVIKLEKVSYSYGTGHALSGIDLEVREPSALAIVGPSGSGKTTLLKIINGFLKPQIGYVSVMGLNPPFKDRLTRSRLGYIPQQLGLIRNRTVLENVFLGVLPRVNVFSSLLGIIRREEMDYAAQCIEAVGLGDKRDAKVYRLSGGERRRAAIARALAQKPRIILADELTADLDYVTARRIMDIFRSLRNRDVTIIMTMHDIELASQYADEIVILKNGVKVAGLKHGEVTKETLRRILSS